MTNQGYCKVEKSSEIEGLLLISDSETAVVLELRKKVFDQVVFFVCVSVSFSGARGSGAAENYHNHTLTLHPADKLIAVIDLIRQYELAIQVKRFQQSLLYADMILLPAGKQRVRRISSLLNPAQFPRDNPFFELKLWPYI